MEPSPWDVAEFLGRSDDAGVNDRAEMHLVVVTAMVRAYVRSRGFSSDGPADDLAAVIISSTARLVSNPDFVVEQSVGSVSVRQAVFSGWTLPELAVLNTYRTRAA